MYIYEYMYIIFVCLRIYIYRSIADQNRQVCTQISQLLQNVITRDYQHCFLSAITSGMFIYVCVAI